MCSWEQFENTHKFLLQLHEAKGFHDILRQEWRPLIFHNSLCGAKRTLARRWSHRDRCNLLHFNRVTILVPSLYIRLKFRVNFALQTGIPVHVCVVKAFNLLIFWFAKMLPISRLKILIANKTFIDESVGYSINAPALVLIGTFQILASSLFVKKKTLTTKTRKQNFASSFL